MEEEKKVEIGYFMRQRKPAGRPRLSDEDWAAKHPDGEKRKEPSKSQQTIWAENIAALPEDKRQELELRAAKVDELTFYMNDIARAAREPRRIPGDLRKDWGCCFVDEVFNQVQQFLKCWPLVHSWTTDEWARASFHQDGDQWDDPEYKAFGLRCRIWSCYYSEYLRHSQLWLKQHPEYVADPGVREEIDALVYTNKSSGERRLDDERRKEQEKAEAYRLANPGVKGYASFKEQNRSIQEREQEEAKRAADRLLSGLRDAEAEILRGEF